MARPGTDCRPFTQFPADCSRHSRPPCLTCCHWSGEGASASVDIVGAVRPGSLCPGTGRLPLTHLMPRVLRDTRLQCAPGAWNRIGNTHLPEFTPALPTITIPCALTPMTGVGGFGL